MLECATLQKPYCAKLTKLTYAKLQKPEGNVSGKPNYTVKPYEMWLYCPYITRYQGTIVEVLLAMPNIIGGTSYMVQTKFQVRKI